MNNREGELEARRIIGGKELVKPKSILTRHSEVTARERVPGNTDEGGPALCERPAPFVTHQVSNKSVTLI